MGSFDVYINPLILMGIVLLSGGVGFYIKNRLVSRHRNLVNQYDHEMVLNHAEILDLQKDYLQLEQKLLELSIPVIPMNLPINNPSKEGLAEAERTANDPAARKKLLGKELPAKELAGKDNSLRSSI